jgi:aminomethyltransferase
MAQRTPLYDTHVKAGARIVDFAGWEMPVQYSGILDEHEAVRTRAGLFDVSHMGEVIFRGPRAAEALGRLFTNDLRKLVDGQAQYGCLCRPTGGIVDDVIVYRRGTEDWLVCVNAGNRQKDFEWLRAGEGPGVTVKNESDDWAQLAVQGPKAAGLVQRLSKDDLLGVKTFHFRPAEVAGVSCLAARTGYTGEDGFELFCLPDKAGRLWDALLEAGRADGVIPAGLGARDSLRLESAYRLYGSDMDDDTTPLEAGLGWVVKLDKGDFIGRDALLAQKARGLSKKLVGFTLTERGIPRHGYQILRDGKPAGVVTSGTQSPTLKIPVGLAYVPNDLAAEGSTFAVEIRGRAVAARIVKTPFYSRK